MSKHAKLGDYVTCVHRSGNGSGEGIIWHVVKEKGKQLKIEPVFAATGPSVLKPKWVHRNDVETASLMTLGVARMQLNVIINELLSRQRLIAGVGSGE